MEFAWPGLFSLKRIWPSSIHSNGFSGSMRRARSRVLAAGTNAPACAWVCACWTSALVAGLNLNCFGGGRGGSGVGTASGGAGCGWAVPGPDGVCVAEGPCDEGDSGGWKTEHADKRLAAASNETRGWKRMAESYRVGRQSVRPGTRMCPAAVGGGAARLRAPAKTTLFARSTLDPGMAARIQRFQNGCPDSAFADQCMRSRIHSPARSTIDCSKFPPQLGFNGSSVPTGTAMGTVLLSAQFLSTRRPLP
jgi:hypothetical protein